MNIRRELYEQCVAVLEEEARKATTRLDENRAQIRRLAHDQKYLKQRKKAAHNLAHALRNLGAK
jgi:chaperonin cofactor prefoldin